MTRPADKSPQQAAPLEPNLDAPSDLGIMVGFPPPPEKLVTRANMMAPGHLRWSFMNQSRLFPTTRVSRGEEAITPFGYGQRLDVDSLPIAFEGNDTLPMQDFYRRSAVDALLVVHRGEIVFERYFGDMTASTLHALFSCTKGFVGLLVEWLIQEGEIDRGAAAGTYVPELQGTALGEATVQQLQDMQAHFDFSAFPPRVPGQVQVGYLAALGFIDGGPDYAGPKGVYETLATNTATVPHGGAFRYDNGSTDTLGWILRRVTGKSLDQLIGDRLWSKLGAEHDASFFVDLGGTEWAAGGLSATARDLARFGEMLRCNGMFNGTRIVPDSVIAEIGKAGDRDVFEGDPMSYPGGSYHNQWWFFHDEFDSFAARGQFGQRLWIAPTAETVIVQFSTDPDPTGSEEPLRLAAWQTIARALAS